MHLLSPVNRNTVHARVFLFTHHVGKVQVGTRYDAKLKDINVHMGVARIGQREDQYSVKRLSSM
jgi:hypothetical protein